MSNNNDEYVSYQEATDRRLRGKTGQQKSAEGVVEWASETSGIQSTAESLYQSVKSILTPNPSYLEKGTKRNLPSANRGSLPQSVTNINLNTLSQQQLLAVIAQVQILQLQSINDMADYLQPGRSITVSGTNAINSSDVPQVVVPQSDQTNIPTKVLYIESDPDNTYDIYIGDDAVAPSSGFVLGPGDSMDVKIDLRNDQLYMACVESGEQVDLLGLY